MIDLGKCECGGGIVVTIKGMAEEWVKENCDDSLYSFRGQELCKAYIAGYKKANEWHDVSNSLPASDKEKCYFVMTKHKELVVARYYEDVWSNYCVIDDVIKWKEVVLPEETEDVNKSIS